MYSYKKKKSQKLSPKISVNIPIEVGNQIKHLCKTINTIEWSGVLFYTMEGSIKDPENCEITLQQILPMDIGTSGYTEYQITGEVTKFMRENNALEKEWKMGHIHSHHSMSVFFSSTDTSELEDNSENHNFYLSVIVNNKGDITGKVGITAESNIPETGADLSYIAIDEEGEEYSIEDISVKQDKKFFEYDCIFFKEEEELLVSEEFKNLMSKMQRHNRSEFSNPSNTSSGEGDSKIGFRSQNSQVSRTSGVTSTSYNKPVSAVSRPDLEDRLDELRFKLFCNGDVGALAMSSLEDILEYWVAIDQNGDELAEEMIQAYPKAFEEIFKDEKQPPRFYILRKMFETFEEMKIPGNVSYNIVSQPIAKAFKELYDEEWSAKD